MRIACSSCCWLGHPAKLTVPTTRSPNSSGRPLPDGHRNLETEASAQTPAVDELVEGATGGSSTVIKPQEPRAAAG